MQEDPPKLDYAPPHQLKDGGDAFPTILFIYPAVPIAGFALKISVLFVVGGIFTPVALLVAII